MKHALKAAFLMILGSVLLATLHSHVNEHQIPHPHAAKASLANPGVIQQQMPVACAAISVLASEHLATDFVSTSSAVVALLEGEQFSVSLRGPPFACPLCAL